jgi:hypothetical protein
MHHLKRPDAEKKPQSVQKTQKLGDKKHLLIMPTKRKKTYPVLLRGGRGTIQPSSKALSIIEHSMFFIETGSSIMPRTQEPSQGAGHTLPVNSGKLFVSSNLSNASRHLFWCTNSLNSGILFPRGHPEFS